MGIDLKRRPRISMTPQCLDDMRSHALPQQRRDEEVPKGMGGHVVVAKPRKSIENFCASAM